MKRAIFLVFFLSGAAGLVYESVWSRYLGLFVGHAAYAQVLVVSLFLGGMALGAAVAGARSSRIRDPLRAYVAVELAVGLLGITFHPLFLAATGPAYEALLPRLPGAAAILAVKWILCAGLLAPPSVLLGTTFPLLAAALLRLRPREPGRSLALLYFSNSLGGAAGVLAAGFVLVGAAGLPGTVAAAALLNAAAALGAWGVRRAAARAGEGGGRDEGAEGPAEGPAPAAVPPPCPPLARGEPLRLLVIVAFATALASFLYEVAWIRMLSLVLGSATHSFELMLSAFILGLALGAAWIRRRADSLAEPLRVLARAQWAMGALALATMPLYLASFSWMAGFLESVPRTGAGYAAFNLFRYSLCIAVMIPSTFCAGMTLPLILRILVGGRLGEGAVGRVYGINTLGSIAGMVLGASVLLPWIGLRGTLLVGGGIDMALGAALFARCASRRRAAVSGVWGLALVAAVAAWVPFERRVLTSGVYRHGIIPRAGSVAVEYYRDGRTATVSVTRTRDGRLGIATNGKPDASLPASWFAPAPPPQTPPPAGTQGEGGNEDRGGRASLRGDASTEVLLGLMPLAFAPRARRVAVVGQGSGITSHFVLASPAVEQVETIEIEPAMIEGSRKFLPANRRVFDDPRHHFVVEDARTRLALGRDRYDVVISEPSNPWVSGVAGLFTVEFYRRAARSLSPHGVFGQWLHLYETSDLLVVGVLAAIHRAFGDYQAFLLNSGDLLVVATPAERLAEPDWSVMSWPRVRADLARFAPLEPEHLEAMRILDRRVLRGLLEKWGRVNSDFRPYLDLGGERARFLGGSARGILALAKDRFDLASPLMGRPRPPLGDAAAAGGGGVPVASQPRLEARALSAWMRGVASGKGGGREGGSERAWRWRALDEFLRSDLDPPGGWQRFVSEALAVEGLLDAGTAGERYEPWYEGVLGYLERRGAPAGARAAVEFVGAWALEDYEALSRAGAILLDEGLEGRAWIDGDLLVDGTVLAALARGDRAGALRLARRGAPLRRRGREDFRSLLLGSLLLAPPEPLRR